MAPSCRKFLLAIIWLGTLCCLARAESPDAERYLGEGLGATWNGKYDEAIAAYTKAIALEPKYVLAYAGRSSAYQMSGNLDLALADSNRALELAPRYSGCYLTRAGIYLDLREPEKALTDLNRAIELRPLAVAFYRRGEAYYALGQYESAIKDFSQAISPTDQPEPQNLDPLDQSTAVIDLEKELPYYYRGLAHQRLGQTEEAVADLSKAAELNQGITAQLAKTSGATSGSTPLDQAVKTYAGELGEEPSDDGFYFDPNRADFAKHDFVSALADLNAILQINPGDNQARIDRGYVQFKLNNFARSLDDDSLSLNYNAGNKDAYNNRAMTYLTVGEYDRAIDDYYMVIRLLLADNPSTSDPSAAHRKALAYCGLGKAFGLKGDDVNAQVSFNLALRIAPDLAIVYRFRGDYETENGKDDLAYADYSHAIQLNPQSAEAFAGRAWVLATSPLIQLRDSTAAVADATKACDLTDWKDPDFLGVLAASFAEGGDFANAAKWQANVVDITSHEADPTSDAEAKRRLVLYQGDKPYAAP